MRLGIREKELLSLFDSLSDVESKVCNTAERQSKDPTYKVMCISNKEQFDQLSFKDIKNGFFSMYDHLENYLESSPTMDLASSFDYKVRSGNSDPSPFKRRRIL